MVKNKLLICDVDGTLAKSAVPLNLAFLRALEVYGIPDFIDMHYLNHDCIGLSVPDLVQKISSDAKIDIPPSVMDEYLKFVPDLLKEYLSSDPQAVRVLSKIQEIYDMTAGSNGRTFNVVRTIEAVGLDGIFQENIIDASYTFTRSAAGQLIEGGRPEVVLVVGDGIGPLVMYEWQEGIWRSRVLIDEVDNGHTLDIVDFDGDGHLDIFNAEMRFGEGNPDSELRILLGDGKGNFSRHVVARGYGVHEGKIVDLDGDGDLDILGKPYTWKAPRLDIWINESKK